MGTIWVKEFTGGLDTRRTAEVTVGGALIKATDGHITRGGDFEQRAAFIPEHELPAGTVGLAYTRTALVVFGSGPTPDGLPSEFVYQRLQAPNASLELIDVPAFDLYSGRLYAVGVFSDGSRHHFYDGARVEDWYDGRSTATFNVVGGEPLPATSAIAVLTITGGVAGNALLALTINGASAISGTVTHTGNNETTATAVAAEINTFVSNPDYVATASGDTVEIKAAVPGSAANGRIISVTTTGAFTMTNNVALAGGENSQDATIQVYIDGVPLMAAPIQWSGSNTATASAIAAAITAYSSTPDYTSVSVDEKVVILAAASGAETNGRSVTFGLVNGFTVDPASTIMAGGSATADTYPPGTFVKTVGSKMYAVSGPNLHFSGIKEPTQWTTDVVGAGFIDMSSQASGSEELTAIAKYQQWVAVFAENTVQVQFVDPDPALNRPVQVLSNTGTVSPRSVTQFGDNDIFYLHESGLRSLQARDSSNSAATFDLGNPIDSLVLAKLARMTINERQKIFGLIEPLSGRFWLTMKDEIFVFSYFNRGEISAWATYTTTYEGENGEPIPFMVDEALVFRRRAYIRSGDTIFCYGGVETGTAHDNTVAEAWLPYLDGDDPTRKKEWQGLDAALDGEWEVSLAMQPTDLSAEDRACIISATTYNDLRISTIGVGTHVSPRFRTRGKGPAKLSSVVIHFKGDENED